MGERLLSGRVTRAELDTFRPVAVQLSDVMVQTSICGLGAVASNPISTFLKFFPELAKEACVLSESEGDAK